MARFHGVIGYGESIEVRPGVWEDVIVEREYYGDIMTIMQKPSPADKVVNNLAVRNHISVVADAYANDHFFAIRYVKWAGAYWTVTEVEVRRPRLIFRVGEVYNGPKAGTPDPSTGDSGE